jgi:hypothetical protein
MEQDLLNIPCGDIESMTSFTQFESIPTEVDMLTYLICLQEERFALTCQRSATIAMGSGNF